MLKNCELCNKVFAHPNRSLCEDCYRSTQKKFDAVKEYLHENPGASVVEVAEATEVEVEIIYEYIKEGRLNIIPKDAQLVCEICGTKIQSGRVCVECRTQLQPEGFGTSAQPRESRRQSSKVHYLDQIKRQRY